MNMPFTFTKRNLAFLLICLGGVTLLVLATIVPLMASKVEVSRQIPEINERLSEQGNMVLALMVVDKKLSDLEKLEKLPAVATTALPITESNSVIDDILELGSRQQLTNVDIAAIMPESSVNLRELSFSTSANGSLSNIRSYIFSLLQIPYVATLKKIEIKSDEAVLHIDMLFTIRLS